MNAHAYFTRSLLGLTHLVLVPAIVFTLFTTAGLYSMLGVHSLLGPKEYRVYAPASPRADLNPLAKITAVSAGGNHTCALTNVGGVTCWGSNNHGQLGGDPGPSHLTPTSVTELTTGVQAISAGGGHTCALTTGGGVKCWGSNGTGQLGNGGRYVTGPTDVTGLTSGVQAIGAGDSHTCALTTDGGVKCWGWNWLGTLHDGTPDYRLTPVNVIGLTGGVQAIAAGNQHTCAITTVGGVKCWGRNDFGQFGNGRIGGYYGEGTTGYIYPPVDVTGLTSGVQAIAAGGGHTCALTTSGGVKCWGDNEYGQLGNGATTIGLTPVDVTGLTSGVQAISAGNAHTCALTTVGGVKCWGYNWYGEAGVNASRIRLTPVDVTGLASGVQAISVGGHHSCALTTTGGVECWGQNWEGQLGRGRTAYRSTPLTIALLSGAQAISAGQTHSCVLTSGGGVKCWGRNFDGQLGDGTEDCRSVPVDVTGLTNGVQAIAAGGRHTCALTTGGGVKCWGDNINGQLGDGTTMDRLTPIDVPGLTSGVQAIAAGNSHTCALTTTGSVKCWGRNWLGSLGDGTQDNRLTPVDLPGLTSSVQAISAGAFHTCALPTAGAVKCWGYNLFGQLGDGTMQTRFIPVDVTDLTGDVQTISTGGDHTCALTTDGSVKCWGYNWYGQLGNGATDNRLLPVDVIGLTKEIQAISAGGEHTCAITTDGGVKCWGNNSDGQVGDGATDNRSSPVDVIGLTASVKALSSGNVHTCALTTEGGVACWGSNLGGQLGIDPGWTPAAVTFVDTEITALHLYLPKIGR